MGVLWPGSPSFLSERGGTMGCVLEVCITAWVSMCPPAGGLIKWTSDRTMLCIRATIFVQL